ncbi:hypothetical protein N7522_002759 [Penicillium canescens]|nr:hypothetical protein N7522_002759 [Penicillium canescens]
MPPTMKFMITRFRAETLGTKAGQSIRGVIRPWDPVGVESGTGVASCSRFCAIRSVHNTLPSG